MTVKELLIKNDLLKYAEKYSEFVKLFNRKIEELFSNDNVIHFTYRGTEYKSKAIWYPEYNQFCSVVYKANKSTNYFFDRCRCNTSYEERTYPVIAGYFATCLTDRKNNK